MNITRAFILMLSCWLSIQTTITTLGGCNFVKEPVGQHTTVLSAQHHCDNSVKNPIVQSQHIHSDCNYCKSHNFNSSLHVLTENLIAPFEIKNIFLSFGSPQHDSVYLDGLQRPPQYRS